MNDDERRLISTLEVHEERLAFTRFDNADASRLGSAMVAAAAGRRPTPCDVRLSPAIREPRRRLPQSRDRPIRLSALTSL